MFKADVFSKKMKQTGQRISANHALVYDEAARSEENEMQNDGMLLYRIACPGISKK